MAGVLKKKDRNVVPRWRNFRKTTQVGELDGIGKANVDVRTRAAVSELLEDFRMRPGTWTAADALGAAIVNGDDLAANEAARYLVASPSATASAIAAARRSLGEQEPTLDVEVAADITVRKRSRDLRHFLRNHPIDAVSWMDLALYQTVLGNGRGATRSARVAAQLAPENRFVLRAAARCLLHWGEAEVAQRLLGDAANVKTDPWILAAEISIASSRGARSSLVSVGRRLVDDKQFSAHSISELATAVGMFEVEFGSNKSARKLFAKALVDPTENAFTQIEWVIRERTAGSVVGIAEKSSLLMLNEAVAMERWDAGDWMGTVDAARLWFQDQPFSSRPADFASFSSFLMGNYQDAVTLLDPAVIANPDEVVLRNNQAYFNLLAGNTEEAGRILERIRKFSGLGTEDRLIVQATQGLFLFRIGDAVAGRDLYARTIAEARRSRKTNIELVSSINLAREELLAGNPEDARVIMAGISGEVRRARDHVLTAQFDRVESMIAGGVASK